MDKFEAFEKLKEYSKKLTEVSYEEIYDLLKNGIKFIPLPLAKLRTNSKIDRVRPNKGTTLFKHINELGYIKDEEVIEKQLTSFGRANKPHQVMFYGALETSLIDKQRLTAIAETSHLFRNPETNCEEGELYTVSRWENQKELCIVEVVFSEYALNNNSDITKSFDNQKKFLQEYNLEPKDLTFHLDFLKFISEEFSKKVTNHEEYKISAAYTNLALLHPEVNGIMYPSVQTDYFGVNIVLTPEIIDDCVIPKICSTQILYKRGMKSLITNGQNYCENLDMIKEIEWQEYSPNLLSTKEEVEEHLK